MTRRTIEDRIRARIEELATELVDLVRREALRSLEQALTGTPDRVAPVPAAASLDLKRHERMGISRALAKAGGDALAAAGTLGLSKSAFYRRMEVHGLSARGAELDADDPVAASGGPVDLEAYERTAIERAMELAARDVGAASRLLGIGKSTLYRKLNEHGMGDR